MDSNHDDDMSTGEAEVTQADVLAALGETAESGPEDVAASVPVEVEEPETASVPVVEADASKPGAKRRKRAEKSTTPATPKPKRAPATPAPAPKAKAVPKMSRKKQLQQLTAEEKPVLADETQVVVVDDTQAADGTAGLSLGIFRNKMILSHSNIYFLIIFSI